MSSILLTHIEGVPQGESAALRPARVRYRVVTRGQIPLDAFSAARALRDSDELVSDVDYRDTNRFLNSMQSLNVGGLTLVDLLRFEGASMWQFLPSFIWPDVFRALEATKVLRRIVETARPTAIVSVAPHDRYASMWHALNRAVAADMGISHQEIPDSSGLRPVPTPRWLIGPRGLRAVLHASAASAGERLLARHWRGTTERNRLLFATLRRHWVPDPASPGAMHDEQLSPLLEALSRASWRSVIAIDCPYEGPTNLRSLRDRQHQTPDWVTWRAFGVGGPRGVRRRERALCAEWWRAISDDARHVRLDFQGIDVYPALTEILRKAVTQTMVSCLAMRERARELLEQEDPDAVMATYETGPYERALLIEAARTGLGTVGLQHGMILDNHYDYMHSNVGPDPKRPFTIPTTTCVWGQSSAEVLTKVGDFPEANVAVTGNWRYRAESEPTDRTAGRRALGLGAESSRLVLLCTAAQEPSEVIQETARIVGGIPDAELRVRPHPSENAQQIEQVLSRHGLPSKHVSTAGAPGEVLAAADLVVSQLSTIIPEALLADRPVVIADFVGQAGWSLYKDSQACLVASSSAELADLVPRALRDRHLQARMADARPSLVYELFNGRDGKAAERVVATLPS